MFSKFFLKIVPFVR